jgi:uncharacterized protein YdhG (YjbR/CyaY superfamily)
MSLLYLKKMKNEVDNYIEKFPPEIQKLAKMLRTSIKKAAPDAGI